MARDGYLILDSDLHMMEPGDLWARYLEAAIRQEPAAILRRPAGAAQGEQGRQGQHRLDHGHERAGAGDPGARHAAGRDRLEPRTAPPQPGAAPAFQRRPGQRLRCALDPDRDGYRGHRRRGDVRHPRPADPVPRRLEPDYAAALARAYNNWAADYCKTDPTRLKFAAQLAMHDVGLGGRGSAALRQRAGRGRGRSARPTRSTASTCTTRRSSRYGTRSKNSTCRSASTRPATPRSRTMPGGAMSATPISTRSPTRSAIRSS